MSLTAGPRSEPTSEATSVEPTTNAVTPIAAGQRSSASLTRRLLVRPETTAVLGTIVVFIFFAVTAGSNGFLTWQGTKTYLEVSATIGIIAVPITLLLISGAFDLSVGAAVGTTGMVVSYVAVELGWSVWLALLAGIVAAVVIGTCNGVLVAFTRIPSFLVTLAMLYILQGVTVAVIHELTDQTTIAGLNDVAGEASVFEFMFAGEHLGLPVSVYWWVGLTVIAAVILTRTKFGNWVYVTGGNREAGERLAVPVRRVHVVLYIAVALAAVIVAVLQTTKVNQADVNRGFGMEFQAAVAAVIGGTLITGGYGSPLGTLVGALLFGMVSQGFFYTDLQTAWFSAFLGVMLLIAVSINQWLKARSMSSSKRKLIGDVVTPAST